MSARFSVQRAGSTVGTWVIRDADTRRLLRYKTGEQYTGPVTVTAQNKSFRRFDTREEAEQWLEDNCKDFIPRVIMRSSRQINLR